MTERKRHNLCAKEIQFNLGLVCYFCHKKSSCRSELDKHIRIHTKEAPFFCNTCSKSFRQNINLNNHKTTHLSKQRREKYKSKLSGKKFQLPSHLKLHILCHT